MKRLMSVSLLTLLGLAGCDAERNESPLGPEVDGPLYAKKALPDLEPVGECIDVLGEITVMDREKQKPTIKEIACESTAGQEADLVVYASNPKTSTVKAWLNGETVLRPSAIPQADEDEFGGARVSVHLVFQEHNILTVRLSAKPGDQQVRSSAEPGNQVEFWVEAGQAPDPPDTGKPLSTDVGIVPTESPSNPVVVADDDGLAIMLLTDPESGHPRGAGTALPGVDGIGLVRFGPTGAPLAAFFGGGVAYFDNWAVDGGTASVSVNIPPGGALPTAAISVALPSALSHVVDWFLSSTPTQSPGGVFGTAQLQALSNGEALATQVAWCALEVAGALPPSADACRTSLIEGVPAFWDQWTEDIGYEPFLPTVVGSLGLGGCTGWDCIAQAGLLTFATIDDATPQNLTIFAGDGQTGETGADLADPLEVLITNQGGTPLAGFLAEFSVTSGGGILDGSSTDASMPTDAAGVASVSWTLGSLVGAQGVAATTISFLDLQVGFTATAEEAASSVSFGVTTAAVSASANMTGACVAEFGSGYRIADWTEVEAAVVGGTAKGDIMASGTAWIFNNGVGLFTEMFQPQHFMISADGPGTPDRGSIGTDLFWLLSGFIIPQPVLCIDPGS